MANQGKEAATIDSDMLTLVDATGTEYKASLEATGAIKDNPDFFLQRR